MKYKILVGLILFGLFSCGKIDDPYIERQKFYPIDWKAAADSSSMSLMNNFWSVSANHFTNDSYGNITWNDYWPDAHGLDVLVDAYTRTGEDIYKNAIYNFYEGIKKKNGNSFWNNYYDDMGWHGLAHMRALEATGDTRYEESARDLWEWILEGWDEEGGGGIVWNHNPDGTGKGVPSNGPAALMAARRWQKYGDSEIMFGNNDSIWLMKIYEFMRENCVEPQTGRVYDDKYDPLGDWTYNAGTYVGAALEFYKISGNRMYLNDAIKTANWCTSTLVNKTNKVLSDWAEQTDDDVNLFKGIFVRYLTQLIMFDELPEGNRRRYINFLKNSANYLWQEGTQKSPIVIFNHRWWEMQETGVGILRSQLSGNMLMEAMALLEKEGYLDTE